MNPALEKWVAQICAGDVRAISRAVSAIENGVAEAQLLIRELFPSTGRAWRIGITGAAGTGKSTLTSGLAAHYRGLEKKVGIIAVDPSSPFSGGSVLGDRIRMQDHASDEGVFIRSMAARGASGGLAQATADTALILDAAGKDVVLIETVGVGQDEIEIVGVADCVLVVLTPGAGDDVQSMKAGLMEIADIFVLNKSDYDGADQFEQQLLSAIQIGVEVGKAKDQRIVRTVATERKGIGELAAAIADLREKGEISKSIRDRERAYWRSWLVRTAQNRLAAHLAATKSRELDELAAVVASRKKDPYAAADELLAALGFTQSEK